MSADINPLAQKRDVDSREKPRRRDNHFQGHDDRDEEREALCQSIKSAGDLIFSALRAHCMSQPLRSLG